VYRVFWKRIANRGDGVVTAWHIEHAGEERYRVWDGGREDPVEGLVKEWGTGTTTGNPHPPDLATAAAADAAEIGREVNEGGEDFDVYDDYVAWATRHHYHTAGDTSLLSNRPRTSSGSRGSRGGGRGHDVYDRLAATGTAHIPAGPPPPSSSTTATPTTTGVLSYGDWDRRRFLRKLQRRPLLNAAERHVALAASAKVVATPLFRPLSVRPFYNAFCTTLFAARPARCPSLPLTSLSPPGALRGRAQLPVLAHPQRLHPPPGHTRCPP
jgi:hypothetical protein